MSDAVPGADVAGVWTTADGKKKTATVKTGADGRAIFSDLPPGATFIATATVQGETLTTQPFAVPDKGGTRFLMIVGGNAAQAMGDPAGGDGTENSAMGAPSPQPVGLRSGSVEARDGVKVGSVEIKVLDSAGKALAGVSVDLGHAAGQGVDLVHAVTDTQGVAHFAELPTDGKTPYAAVVTRDGMRISTPTFVLETKRGAAGEIRLPGQTDSLSVLRLGNSSRMLVELREGAIGILQNLIVENTSDKVFDPGSRGLFVPLPEGFANAEKIPGGSEIEVKEDVGVFFHGNVPPTQSMSSAVQIRLSYSLATHESRDVEIVQPMPLGLQGGLVMVPAEYALGLSAPGLRARGTQRDDSGNELRIFELDAVPAGQALHLTVLGLPAHSRTGRWIAGAIASLILVVGIVAARRPRKKGASNSNPG